MQQIADWLKKLGLSEYAQRFAENRVDFSVLPELTDQDLKDLGIVLGDRRKLLRAIADLNGIEKIQSKPTEAATTPVAPQPQDSAERRQVSVMLADLVGSTALSARMDPEDLREIISAYQRCVTETVGRLGGFVAKYMGDGVLVYFGYPQAHEDDAERAVRAGLELITAVSALKAPVSLQTRVGIATGLVVVGDLIGSGEAQERGIVGETPNLAARLQSMAEPNTVVMAESTRTLLGNLFELGDLGAKDLKGIARPVRAWAALRASSVASRFEALHTAGLTALVGREEELELLLRRWSRAKRGEGQVVLLSGEAGIGKSRLTASLMERLVSEPHMRLRYFCSPQHTDSAHYPVIGQMERAAGFVYDDTPQTKLDKLDAVLADTSTRMEDAALFAEMLSLPNDGRYPALDLEPQQRRQKTLEALTAQVEALSRQNPLLTIFEDAHWTDPTSLETLGRVVDRVRSLPVLLIVTFRPEFEPPWIGRPYVTALTINRLAPRDIEAMIDGVVGNKFIPTSVRHDIIERTDGIPLFVEEMTKAVLEAGSEGGAERTVASIPSPKLSVPASLQASLMARLDRLGPAKEVAQIGAAIGREFSYALLSAVATKPEPELASALDRLIGAGLLFRQGVPPQASYLFKHALVQDAAYGTLLREPRRALHARIAEAIESHFPDIADSQPELAARHYTEAGLIEKAVYLWGKAGERSLERSSLVEAIEQLTRALAQIETLPSSPTLRQEEIKLQVALVPPLLNVKGFNTAETKAATERARLLIEHAEALGEPLKDPLLLYSVLFGGCVANFVGYNGAVLRELAAQFLALAESQGATAPLMAGHSMMGVACASAGKFLPARAHHDQALVLYDPTVHRALLTRFAAQDQRVVDLSFRSLTMWMLGYPDAALADAERALQDAREIDHASTLMFALWWTGLMKASCGCYTAANALGKELVALADQNSSPTYRVAGTLVQGSVLALTEKSAHAIEVITGGLSAHRSMGTTFLQPFFLSLMALVHTALGQSSEASRCIDEAMTIIKKSEERWFEAEVNRIAGEIALMAPEPDAAKAQECFEQALAIARAQQAKSWELRAAMSMARLWRDQGKQDAARELLAPVHGWFTEGFDTLDLKEAKALLDELHA
jgi:class 3 adenylate cyclase/predicted ATPase